MLLYVLAFKERISIFFFFGSIPKTLLDNTSIRKKTNLTRWDKTHNKFGLIDTMQGFIKKKKKNSEEYLSGHSRYACAFITPLL